MTNAEIAQLFADIADMLEIQGEDRYRYLAYRRAADELGQYPGSVEALWRDGRLEEVPGVGKTIATKIDELLSSSPSELIWQKAPSELSFWDNQTRTQEPSRAQEVCGASDE